MLLLDGQSTRGIKYKKELKQRALADANESIAEFYTKPQFNEHFRSRIWVCV